MNESKYFGKKSLVNVVKKRKIIILRRRLSRKKEKLNVKSEAIEKQVINKLG